MTPISADSLTEALHWRYATKKFDPSRKIPAATWAALEQSLVLAPSSYGLQPWKFVVVEAPAVKEKLSAAAHGQRQPADCSHFVVFCGRKGLDAGDVDRYVHRIAEVRGVPAEGLKHFGDLMKGSAEHARKAGTLDAWVSHQVYIALGMFMTSAALLGVDACPMEGIQAPKFDEILGLSALGYGALCACAAGYRAADDKNGKMPKVRFQAQDVILRA
ncbi:MAG TPA: NAD(P)H-dependent oxidoreductase [Opitutaceae bacterium]